MMEIQTKSVYTVEDIRTLLSLGRTGTYEFLNRVFNEQKPFRVIKIGRQIRVPRREFDAWLNGEVKNA